MQASALTSRRATLALPDGSAVTKMPYVGLDITDQEAVRRVISGNRPDAVIHCAAWTAVDMAEDDDKVEKVRAVNAGGTRNIAEACKEIGCKMLYLSTDYVFDGQGTEPWKPDCKDYKPLNVYGQTKLEGELTVANTLEKYFIVRIAWVFGLNGKNFIKTMTMWARHTMRCAWSTTRSARRRTPLIWLGCWWICAKQRSMVTTTPPMRAATSAGTTSAVNSINSMDSQRRSFR